MNLLKRRAAQQRPTLIRGAGDAHAFIAGFANDGRGGTRTATAPIVETVRTGMVQGRGAWLDEALESGNGSGLRHGQAVWTAWV